MIVVNNVNKTYKGTCLESDVHALKNINFTIALPCFVGIIGESGSGKSTLLNVLGGLDKPTLGSVVVENARLDALSDNQLAKYRNEMVGFVFQNYLLDPDLTAKENVEMPMIIKGKKKDVRNLKSVELLKKMGLESKINVKVKNLSGGQMQRVCIARALANNPKVILADEPTGNLDSKNGQSIISIFRQLVNSGIFVILVTHNLNEAKY